MRSGCASPPAANRSERSAIRRLLAEVSAMRIVLPGDPHQRLLRFELQQP